MTRVTGQKTRQAVLILDALLDTTQMPERLALFDEEGNPLILTGFVGIPPGGDTDQTLIKVSDDSYDVAWVEVPSGALLLDDGDPTTEQPLWDLTGAGVSITNDPVNGKLIINIPGGMASGDIKAVVAALASGDKLAWEQSSADFAEIYANFSTPGWVTQIDDHFSTDTSANYTKVRHDGNVTPPTYSVTGGELVSAAGTTAHSVMSSLSTAKRSKIKVKGRDNNYGDFFGPAMLIDGRNGIAAYLVDDPYPNRYLRIVKIVNGTPTQLAQSASFPLTGANADSTFAVWWTMERNNNVLTFNAYYGDPDSGGTLAATLGHTLSGGDATTYGAGVALLQGMVAAVASGQWRWDDLKVETFDGETRELLVAQTNDVGVRTVRKLLRSDGLSEIGPQILDGTTAKTQRPKLAFTGFIVTDNGGVEKTVISPLKYAADLGAITSATPLTVTHNLNTKDVAVTVYRISDGVEDTTAVKTRNGVNTVQLTFPASYAANIYRVVVQG